MLGEPDAPAQIDGLQDPGASEAAPPEVGGACALAHAGAQPRATPQRRSLSEALADILPRLAALEAAECYGPAVGACLPCTAGKLIRNLRRAGDEAAKLLEIASR